MKCEVKKVWKYKGHECVVKRIFTDNKDYINFINELGLDMVTEWLCGYVNVDDLKPNDRYFYGENIDCHGGITFIGRMNLSGLEDNYIGFDCNHFGDTSKECTLDYCVKECESIVEQLIELGELETNGKE